ncbi:MAG: ferrous iron transport protein B [Clostridium sp.]|nr:ferrous iron transport protein B [Clostridium sp.]
MSVFGCKNCKNCVYGCKKENNSELPKIILVGNPNVGKSVIFNAISGFYVEVSNYPGTTVDIAKAYTEYGEIIDTPGTYGLGNYTDDEVVTQNILKEADIIINIVSALSLERDLFLTQQLIDLALPVIVVVNQVDEAKKRSIAIDTKRLSELLDVTVISAVAVRNIGINEIINEIKKENFKISSHRTPYIKLLCNGIFPCDVFSKIMSIESHENQDSVERDELYKERRENITKIFNEVVKTTAKQNDFYDLAERLFYNPIVNFILSVLVLYLLFQIIGVFISGNVVDFAFGYLNEHYYPWINSFITGIFHTNLLTNILVGEFGVLTMAVGIIFGILLPLLSAFYFFMALLEDSGYLPRLAAFSDNILNKIGLNGRAVIPLLLGFGCGTMGTLTTRILGSKKERTIATAILGITIPCAAQQGIIIALLASIGGLKVWLIYLGLIFIIMGIVGKTLDMLLPGSSTELLISIPPIRMPNFRNIVYKTFSRVMNFLKEACYLFAIGSVIITVLNHFGFLKWLQKALEPIVVHLLHLPAEFSDVFVMGLIRRDFASVGLFNMAGLEGNSSMVMTPLQILTSAVVITLFVPCFASLVVIYKERGIKEATVLWLGTFVISVLAGALVTRVCGFMF